MRRTSVEDELLKLDRHSAASETDETKKRRGWRHQLKLYHNNCDSTTIRLRRKIDGATEIAGLDNDGRLTVAYLACYIDVRGQWANRIKKKSFHSHYQRQKTP